MLARKKIRSITTRVQFSAIVIQMGHGFQVFRCFVQFHNGTDIDLLLWFLQFLIYVAAYCMYLDEKYNEP